MDAELLGDLAAAQTLSGVPSPSRMAAMSAALVPLSCAHATTRTAPPRPYRPARSASSAASTVTPLASRRSWACARASALGGASASASAAWLAAGTSGCSSPRGPRSARAVPVAATIKMAAPKPASRLPRVMLTSPTPRFRRQRSKATLPSPCISDEQAPPRPATGARSGRSPRRPTASAQPPRSKLGRRTSGQSPRPHPEGSCTPLPSLPRSYRVLPALGSSSEPPLSRRTDPPSSSEGG